MRPSRLYTMDEAVARLTAAIEARGAREIGALPCPGDHGYLWPGQACTDCGAVV